MSEENGVQPADLFAEHLHAKLRRRVHDQFGFLGGDVNGRPGAMVFRIRQKLWRILLPDDRHALRSPRAQANEREGHGGAGENLAPPNHPVPQCPDHGPIPNPRARSVMDRPGNQVARTYLAARVFSHGALGKNHRQNFFCRTLPQTPNSARTISAMLTTLRVKNLALVADLTLELQPGLNVVTGETGAGKSILNGAPATLHQLAIIGEWLVDIHGPHDHQSLLHPAKQLAILDAFGGLHPERAAFAELVRR